MFGVFVNFSAKSFKKLLKKHELSSIWPKVDSFRANCHVSAFWSTFQQKVAKRGSFREKARKMIDSAKTCNFSSESCSQSLASFFVAVGTSPSFVTKFFSLKKRQTSTPQMFFL